MRFEFDPSTVTSSIPVLPKNDYEFIIGEPKSFIRKNAKGEDSYGVRYPLTVAEGEKKGQRIFFSTYYQSEGGQSAAKRFLMAVYGYKSNDEEEQRFNADMKGQDWAFDPDSGGVGEAFRNVTGKRVRGSLDVQPAKDRDGNETGEQNQNFKAWFPMQAMAVSA
jgi:hypothetical protein